MGLARTGWAPAPANEASATLRERVDGEVCFDGGARATYSTAASVSTRPSCRPTFSDVRPRHPTPEEEHHAHDRG
jgi:hypothetical protein